MMNDAPYTATLPMPSDRHQDRKRRIVATDKGTDRNRLLLVLDMRNKARPLHLLVGTAGQRTETQENFHNHKNSG